jgi:hypothetical protein
LTLSLLTVTRHPSLEVMSSASFWIASHSFSTWDQVTGAPVAFLAGAVADVTLGKGTGGADADPGRFRAEAARGEAFERKEWGLG